MNVFDFINHSSLLDGTQEEETFDTSWQKSAGNFLYFTIINANWNELVHTTPSLVKNQKPLFKTELFEARS